MANERQCWVGFSLVKGIGPGMVCRLLGYFDSLSAAWEADPAALREAGLDRRAIDNLVEARRTLCLEAEMARLDKLGIAVLTRQDEEYPSRLLMIDDPPPVLYMRGTLTEADDWAVAVVGTRRATPYGRQVTYQIAYELAANRVTIVSGMARGIDGEAHRGALDAGGRTIAVLGAGMDTIYPPEHRMLAAEIIQQGAIMTSYALGTPPEARNFPPRNRIISGLSLAVVVTEAGEGSGALLTAEIAAEQGRDVFAVPGNITAQGSSGANRLIQDGAQPVLAARDILDQLELARVTDYVEAREALPPLGEVERAVLEHLGAEPLHVDDLCRAADLPVAQVSSTLAMLELKGMVRQVGAMTYTRT